MDVEFRPRRRQRIVISFESRIAFYGDTSFAQTRREMTRQ